MADSNAAPTAFSNPKSMAFDGAHSYVSVADFPPPTSLTMSAWIYPTAADTVDRIILNKGNSEYDFRISQDTGGLHGSAGGIDLTYRDFNFSAVGNRGKWYHVACTFDKASASQKLYVNGALVASGSNNAAIPDTHYELWIGRNSQYELGTFLGNIDDVHLYDRALSPDEIASLAQVPVQAATAPASGGNRSK